MLKHGTYWNRSGGVGHFALLLIWRFEETKLFLAIPFLTLTHRENCSTSIAGLPVMLCVFCAVNGYPGLQWLAGRGRSFSPSTQLSWDPICSAASSFWAPSTRGTWTCLSESRQGPWRCCKGWSTSPVREGWELDLFSLEKIKLWEDIIEAFQYLERAYKKDEDRFLVELLVTGQRIVVLN